MKSWDLAAGQIDEMMMILCIQFASIEVYSISAWERKYIVWLCYKIEMFEQIPHFFQIPNFFFFWEGGYKKVRGISTCDQLCTHSNALDGSSWNKTETCWIRFHSKPTPCIKCTIFQTKHCSVVSEVIRISQTFHN